MTLFGRRATEFAIALTPHQNADIFMLELWFTCLPALVEAPDAKKGGKNHEPFAADRLCVKDAMDALKRFTPKNGFSFEVKLF